jgi:hypothetical protein
VQNLLKKKDFYAGLAMILLGAVVTLNSTTYKLGTLMHMGPGMFPFILGILLTFIGILIFGTGVITPLADERILPESMEWRGWACILGGPKRDMEGVGHAGRRHHGRRHLALLVCAEGALPAVPLGAVTC